MVRGFSQDACRRTTVKMIVLNKLPFSVVDNHFYSVVASRYILPSQRTIIRDTLDLFVEEKTKLKSLLVENK